MSNALCRWASGQAPQQPAAVKSHSLESFMPDRYLLKEGAPTSKRDGIQGTIPQGIRAFDLRHSR